MAITEVQRVEVTGAATDTAIAASVDAFIVGRTVRVLVRCDDDPTGITVSDDVGNTYVSLGGVLEAGTTQWLEEFYTQVDTASAATVTAVFNATQTGRAICVLEYSGITGGGAPEGDDQETDTGSNPTPTLSANSTTSSGVMFCACNDVQGGTPSVGSGFTDDGVIWSGFSNCRLQRKNTSTIGAQTGNFGNSSLNRNNSTAVIYPTDAPAENIGALRSQNRTMPMIRGPR